ncbi:MAG: PRC-barrel domain-containing protein [Opitutaceae bacterium]|nr:PRC-barrel domain-containing protein [Cytophagales bacterium]
MKTIEKNYDFDNKTGRNHEGPNANIPVKRLTAGSIIGDNVENYEGENLGTIDDLMINIQTGIVEYVVIEYGSFLGLGGKMFAIPFEELELDEEKECFIVSRDMNYLKNAPGFDQNHWPDTNDHTEYLNQVTQYYQVANGMYV